MRSWLDWVLLRSTTGAMVYDDFKPGSMMYGGTQLCGLSVPRSSSCSSGMHGATDLQNCMETMHHGSLEPDIDESYLYHATGKRSGLQERSQECKLNTQLSDFFMSYI